MENSLVLECERILKDDPTGQKRAFQLAKMEGAKGAYLKVAQKLEWYAKDAEASARELDLFIELFEGQK